MDTENRCRMPRRSAAGTAKEAVDELREEGKKVGVLKLRVFRPFPAEEIVEAIKNCKAVAIMDRCESYNARRETEAA